MEALLDYLEQNKLNALSVDGEENVFEIEGIGKFLFLNREHDKEAVLFDEHFRLNIDKWEKKIKVDFYCYEFGGEFYYSKVDEENVVLNQLRYLGKADLRIDKEFCHLGIHGGYELLNGSGLYKDWVKKAKFFGLKSLGICEYNTLAGTLPFQLACKDVEIKSIIGETVLVRKDDYDFQLKLFVKNNHGWQNLLNINTEINVNNQGYVTFEQLLENSKDLICVLPSNYDIDKKDINGAILSAFEHTFYQVDSVIWQNDRKDKEALLALKKYLESNLVRNVKPILLNDSYYLDKKDAIIKELLNKVSEMKGQYSSYDQYFKSLDDIEDALKPLFSDEEKFNKFFDEIIENTIFVKDNCDFKIDTTHFRLPKYEMTQLEKDVFATNEDLFYWLMQKGLDKKVSKDKHEQYKQRLEEEIRVIKLGGFIDYFLILWDIMQFCKKENILRGIGRGSAAGCLISYLLDITEADPIEYNLIFERFLNESRVNSGLPDIDCDFPGTRRDDVKRYMEQRYGLEYVASIGTYTTLKIKMALKDIGRAYGLDFKDINVVNSFLTKDVDGKNWQDLLEFAAKDDVIKKFVKDNTEFINTIQICLNQPRSSSIHASAVIIVPKEDENGNPKNIYQWLPVRKVGEMLVSEWEHAFVEKSGFLKEDILGIAQLDKFASILNLIKKNHDIDIDIYSIPLDDKDVFALFKLGLNEDVFQFGSDPQKAYSKKVMPDNIEHLNAMNALYRPGPMDVGAHEKFAKIKNKLAKEEYFWGTEEVLKDTFGLIVYQEQTMKIAQVLADFSMTEADGLRRALTKKGKGHEAENFKNTFITRCVEKGCSEFEANEIWDALEAFTKYGFNRSHSLSYAITGYICNWFKKHYPLEFWVTSLQFSKEEEIFKKISEIDMLRKMGEKVELVPPDINSSINEFYPDLKTGKIYWSINKIKFIGEEASRIIMEERNKNGNFYSLEEFIKRVPKNKVNKRVITNLIYSGAFDQIEVINDVRHRYKLFEQYCEISKLKIEKEFPKTESMKTLYWWKLKQKESCGFAYIDYDNLLAVKNFSNVVINDKNVYDDWGLETPCCTAGVINKINHKQTKGGDKFAEVRIDCNNEIIFCNFWYQSYAKHEEALRQAKIGDILLVSGEISFNKFKNFNTVNVRDDSRLEILNI